MGLAKPRELPAPADLLKAFEIIEQYRLHFYQLLYFQTPRLTCPDNGLMLATPFAVGYHKLHSHCIEIRFQRNPDYTFLIPPPWAQSKDESDLTQDQRDKLIIEKCKIIQLAQAEGREKAFKVFCCPLAVSIPCVCNYAFDCPLHGKSHTGSHD